MEPKAKNDGSTAASSHGLNTLFPQLYEDLLRMAAARARDERRGHTLQPTAIVHEVYLRLNGSDMRWKNEAEFRRYVAPIIRHVLVDYARSRPKVKAVTVTSWEGMNVSDGDGSNADVLALNEVLERLGKRDSGLVRILELRYFGGLTEEETAEAEGMPLGTLKNKLTFARTWLRREFTKLPKR